MCVFLGLVRCAWVSALLVVGVRAAFGGAVVAAFATVLRLGSRPTVDAVLTPGGVVQVVGTEVEGAARLELDERLDAVQVSKNAVLYPPVSGEEGVATLDLFETRPALARTEVLESLETDVLAGGFKEAADLGTEHLDVLRLGVAAAERCLLVGRVHCADRADHAGDRLLGVPQEDHRSAEQLGVVVRGGFRLETVEHLVEYRRLHALVDQPLALVGVLLGRVAAGVLPIGRVEVVDLAELVRAEALAVLLETFRGCGVHQERDVRQFGVVRQPAREALDVVRLDLHGVVGRREDGHLVALGAGVELELQALADERQSCAAELALGQPAQRLDRLLAGEHVDALLYVEHCLGDFGAAQRLAVLDVEAADDPLVLLALLLAVDGGLGQLAVQDLDLAVQAGDFLSGLDLQLAQRGDLGDEGADVDLLVNGVLRELAGPAVGGGVQDELAVAELGGERCRDRLAGLVARVALALCGNLGH